MVFSYVRFLRFIARVHLHGNRHKIRIQQECLAYDRVMPVFLGRPFLLVLPWKINLKVIVGAVEVHPAEIPPVQGLIAMV